MPPVPFWDFKVLDIYLAAKDSFAAYLADVAADPMMSLITHPVPTFMALVCAGVFVISRNGPAL